MTWLAVSALVVVIAGAFYYLKRGRQRQLDFKIITDPDTEAHFYPEIEKCHEINTRSITCSCPDFRNEREQFRHDDPRRLCKHLVRSFVDANSLPEELILFKEGIERCHESHSGFPTDKRRFDTFNAGEKISLMIPKETSEEDPWVDVYCEGRRYCYSPKLQGWADEKAPPREGPIIGFLYEKIGRPIPEAVLNGIKTPEVAAEKRRDEKRTAESTQKEFCDVESVLRTLLPPDGELTVKETKNYVAVMFNGSRKWICRLYLNARKSRYIEFPGGTRYELTAAEDIAHYREQLMNAYSEQGRRKEKTRLLFPIIENASSNCNAASIESRDNTHLFSRN